MIPMNEKRYIIDRENLQILMITNIKESEQTSIAGNPAYKIVVADLITRDFANVSPVCTAGRSDGPKAQPRLEWEVDVPKGRYSYYSNRDEAMTVYLSLKMGEREKLTRKCDAVTNHIKKAWMTLQEGK